MMMLAAGMLFAADIDVKLYDSDQREAYYDEVQQQIDSAEKNAQRPEAILHEEKLQLSRVRAASAQSPQIERYDVSALSKTPLGMQTFYGALHADALTRIKLEGQRQLLRDIQSKLQFLKSSIERITEDEKPRLLIYQLQFAYYKLQQKNLEAKSALLDKEQSELTAALAQAIPALKCADPELMLKRLKEDDTAIENVRKRRIFLEIDWEKALIEENDRRAQIQAKRDAADADYSKVLGEKSTHLTEYALCLLQQKRNSDFFKQLGLLEELSAKMRGTERSSYQAQDEVLRDLSKKVFGATTLFLGSTLQETKEMVAGLTAYLTAPIFVYNEQPISFLSLLKAVVIVILGFMTGMFYKRWVTRMARRWPDMSQMSIRLASNIGYYLIVFVALMISISSIGIDMTSLSLIAGALSIGIGFGLQNVVSNLIAGIILMFERTIRIGDTIEINDVLRGRVTDMRIRSTTVKTFDNVDIVVPNSSFVQNNVINWTLEDRTRRLHIPFGVAYGTDVDVVKKAVLDELNESSLHYIKDDPEKSPEVWMIAMNSSSVDFELLVWIEWASPLKPNSLRSDFMILIYNALYRNGITIPFPQLDLYVKELPSNNPS
jgi:small-conductance mechanosensitive channel